ncbi:UNVERIFIED_CONTAM: hypothetical protein HDU68_000075 [Siphonaria sp. JEL0065]|nr:hypothetical protein HDU68_000075 [Siphonaria sp. JEL0065]
MEGKALRSSALQRFRSIAQFVRATVVLARTYSGRPLLDLDGEATADGALLTAHAVGLEATAGGLVASGLVARFGTLSCSSSCSPTGSALHLSGSLRSSSSGSSSSTSSRSSIAATEARALELFEAASFVTPFKRLPIAVSVVAFFNEFALAGMQEPNYANAERLYNLAAAMNCTFAQARLAFLKMHGRPNIKINQTIAEQYRSTLAALSKSLNLSNNSEISTSLSWLHILAVNHHPAAQFCLGLCHYNGIGAPKNNTSTYIWCHRAAIQGHPGAMNMLGNLYTEGHGTTKTPTLGLRWYIRAAERKDAAAIYNIGTLFERGIAVDEDARQAFEWYVRASVFGSVNAQNVLGIFYEQGVGVPQAPEKAVQYYKTAAGNGHPHAMYNLARCYHDGFGVVRDDSVALMWFKMASEQNHMLSVLSVALCFDAGVGVFGDRSGQAARRHYWNASKKGSKEAKNRLVEVVALELLVAARPLLAGRMMSPSERKRLLKASLALKQRPSLSSSPTSSASFHRPPIRRISAPKYLSHYDDATEELLEKLGLSYDSASPSRSMNISPSYYANKSSDFMMFPTTPSSSSLQSSAPSFLDREISRAKALRGAYYDESAMEQDGEDFHQQDDDNDDDYFSCDTLDDDDSLNFEDEMKRPQRLRPTATIANLPTELILHILSFLNDHQILTSSQVFQVLKISGNRGTLSNSVTKEIMLDSFGIKRVAVWIDDKNWCDACRLNDKSRCDKIKHYMTRLSPVSTTSN